MKKKSHLCYEKRNISLERLPLKGTNLSTPEAKQLREPQSDYENMMYPLSSAQIIGKMLNCSFYNPPLPPLSR